MKNVSWLGCVARGGSGQLFVQSEAIDIDGLDVGTDWIDTVQIGTFAPRRYVTLHVRGSLNHRSSARGVRIVARTNVTTGVNSSGAIWYPTGDYLLLENCFVSGFTSVSGAAVGQDGNLGGSTGLHIVNCHFDNVGIGFLYQTTTGGQPAEDLLIQGCAFTDLLLQAIRMRGTGTGPPIRNARIANNLFSNTVGRAVQIESATAWPSTGPGLILTGNDFFDNNGGSSNDQVLIEQPASLRGAFHGNNGGHSGTGRGIIHLDGAAPSPVNTTGLEAGYDSSGPTIIAGDQLFVSIDNMFQNNMRYDDTP
jgi:hypothetical protein